MVIELCRMGDTADGMCPHRGDLGQPKPAYRTLGIGCAQRLPLWLRPWSGRKLFHQSAHVLNKAVLVTQQEKFDTKKLPMMPIRDVVIFPCMMTPFVAGRESSVRALEESLAGDKKIFLATQHDASIDEPKSNEIYQVGTIVTIAQSLKLPDGNIKVLVEGLERGKILQVFDTDGYVEATVRTAKYGTELMPQVEASMQRVTGLFEQYLKTLPEAQLRDDDRRCPQ